MVDKMRWDKTRGCFIIAIEHYIAWVPLNIASIEALDQSEFADVMITHVPQLGWCWLFWSIQVCISLAGQTERGPNVGNPYATSPPFNSTIPSHGISTAEQPLSMATCYFNCHTMWYMPNLQCPSKVAPKHTPHLLRSCYDTSFSILPSFHIMWSITWSAVSPTQHCCAIPHGYHMLLHNTSFICM